MTAPAGVWGTAAVAVICATQACAQVSGSLALVSDYRFRGISLSQERPAAQLDVTYDHPGGWYAGLFGSTVRLANESHTGAQLLGYVGYAGRLRQDLSWEIGADYSTFPNAGDYDYAEAYWGIASDSISSRIYYAPEYFGHSSAVYAELNGSRRLRKRLRAFGHLGALRDADSGCCRADVRVGFAVEPAWGHVEFAWVAVRTARSEYSGSDDAFVLNVARPF